MLAEILLQLIPALRSAFLGLQATEDSQLNRWVYYMLLAGVIQLGLLGYMILLMDWATLWAATIGNPLFIAATLVYLLSSFCPRVKTKSSLTFSWIWSKLQQGSRQCGV